MLYKRLKWLKKLVLLTLADIIDQKNQLREVAQCQKYSTTADEVEKKVTTFGENIHLEKFQPYIGEGVKQNCPF